MTEIQTHRRRFLSTSALLLGGAAAGTLVPETVFAQNGSVAQDVAVVFRFGGT